MTRDYWKDRKLECQDRKGIVVPVCSKSHKMLKQLALEEQIREQGNIVPV